MFALFQDAGFRKIKSVVVPNFRFRTQSTRDAGESYGVKAVLFTAEKPW